MSEFNDDGSVSYPKRWYDYLIDSILVVLCGLFVCAILYVGVWVVNNLNDPLLTQILITIFPILLGFTVLSTVWLSLKRMMI